MVITIIFPYQWNKSTDREYHGYNHLFCLSVVFDATKAFNQENKITVQGKKPLYSE